MPDGATTMGYSRNLLTALWEFVRQTLTPQSAIKANIFKTEEDLIRSLSVISELYDGDMGIIACIFAWIGVPEPLKIKDTDVFIEGRKITQDGIVIVDGFSDWVADFLTRYKRLDVSMSVNGRGTYPVYKDKSVDTFIKRFVVLSSPKMGKPIANYVYQNSINALREKDNELGHQDRITYTNILKSGSLNRLYKAEQNGLDVGARENRETVEKFFYKGNYRAISWLYRHYKEAFNL